MERSRRIDLDRARREAKALLAAARAGDERARARLRDDREPRLADAQHAIARELGASSWPALVRGVEEQGRLLRGAARDGDADEVRRLLEAGAPANARDPRTGETALHLAAASGSLDVIDQLVGWAPVDRRARDRAGRTALGACVEASGDLAVARVLVSVGLAVEPAMLDRAEGRLADWLRAQLAQPPRRDGPPERIDERGWAAEAALLALLARSPLSETRTVGDGVAVVTGRWDNSRNGVLCGRLPHSTADAQIESVLGWLREREVPAQWLVREQTEPADLRVRLERAGCEPERTAVRMAADLRALDLSPRPAPAQLATRRLRDEASLAEALGDPEEARLLASLGLGDGAPLRHYGASLGGAAVGAISLLIEETTLEVVGLEVAAAHRRRGIGRALLLRGLREGRAAGCTAVTLAPTPATVPFYEAIGLELERYPPDRAFYTPL